MFCAILVKLNDSKSTNYEKGVDRYFDEDSKRQLGHSWHYRKEATLGKRLQHCHWLQSMSRLKQNCKKVGKGEVRKKCTKFTF